MWRGARQGGTPCDSSQKMQRRAWQCDEGRGGTSDIATLHPKSNASPRRVEASTRCWITVSLSSHANTCHSATFFTCEGARARAHEKCQRANLPRARGGGWTRQAQVKGSPSGTGTPRRIIGSTGYCSGPQAATATPPSRKTCKCRRFHRECAWGGQNLTANPPGMSPSRRMRLIRWNPSSATSSPSGVCTLRADWPIRIWTFRWGGPEAE